MAYNGPPPKGLKPLPPSPPPPRRVKVDYSQSKPKDTDGEGASGWFWTAWLLGLFGSLMLCIAQPAYALDLSPWNDAPSPARAVTSSSVAAAPVKFGYDKDRPHTEWAADYHPYGPASLGPEWKVISRRYVDGPIGSNSLSTSQLPYQQASIPIGTPVQFASYTPAPFRILDPETRPAQTYQPAPFHTNPHLSAPAYQPTYAPQYSSAPAYGSGFSFGGGSCCGPGGCAR